MKKIMLLGGSRYLLPIIKKSKELGIYTITCDNIPDNTAHRYSDRYENISIVEKDKVLAAAKELAIDGIISFACDPGVVTASYVAEQMGLPFQGSYQSVSILQDKSKFRSFLRQNGFNTPWAMSFETLADAKKHMKDFVWPLIVKPVDSAGSKGVTKVNVEDEFESAFDGALKCSISGRVIIEEFLTFQGAHSSADYFTVDGEVRFASYSDQLFDDSAINPYTPAFIIWPSTMEKRYQKDLTAEIGRLMKLLDMKTGIYNIETCVANGKPYIMEVSPRGGGCKIAEIQELCTGARLIENEIRSAVGLPLIDIETHTIEGIWVEMVIHSNGDKSGVFNSIEIAEEIREKYLVCIDQGVKSGDYITGFTGANAALGDLFLHFRDKDEMSDILIKNRDWLKIIYDGE